VRAVPLDVLGRLPVDERARGDVAAGEVGMRHVEAGVEHCDGDPGSGLRRREHTRGLQTPGRLRGVGELLLLRGVDRSRVLQGMHHALRLHGQQPVVGRFEQPRRPHPLGCHGDDRDPEFGEQQRARPPQVAHPDVTVTGGDDVLGTAHVAHHRT
jgi:hypothetical protein